jgi:hypothetical protein
MRRDRVMECTIAAIAGVGLAAVLIAALGVRSAGESTPLRSQQVATAADPATLPAAETSEAAKKARAARKHAQRKRHAGGHHRRRAPIKTAPAPRPRLVAETAPVTTESQPPSTPIRTQSVTPAPAPKPAPVRTPSPPKRTGSGGGGGGGVSFDDSG